MGRRPWSRGWSILSNQRSADRAIAKRWCATWPTCVTASPATRRPGARGISSTCPAACSTSTSWRNIWRCATPTSGPTCATRILPSDVQSLLRLTLDGDESAFDESKAPEGQQRLIAATEGAADLAELRARIAAETAAARAIYRRIVEEPARAAGWQPRRED